MLASLIVILIVLITASVLISTFTDASFILQAILGAFILIVVVLLILYVMGFIGDDGRIRKR